MHKEYHRKYYHDHKEDILPKLKEKVKCECGKKVTKYNLSRHKKTKTHKLLIKLKELEN